MLLEFQNYSQQVHNSTDINLILEISPYGQKKIIIKLVTTIYY